MITWIHEFLGNQSVCCYGAESKNIMDTIFIPAVALAHSFIFPLENLQNVGPIMPVVTVSMGTVEA